MTLCSLCSLIFSFFHICFKYMTKCSVATSAHAKSILDVRCIHSSKNRFNICPGNTFVQLETLCSEMEPTWQNTHRVGSWGSSMIEKHTLLFEFEFERWKGIEGLFGRHATTCVSHSSFAGVNTLYLTKDRVAIQWFQQRKGRLFSIMWREKKILSGKSPLRWREE